MNGSGKVRASACDVLPRMSSPVGRGRRVAVNFAVCLSGEAGILFFFFNLVFLFERTRPAASMRPPCLIHLPTTNEAVFLL